MQNMFKKNLYMMDSMTDDELDGKVSDKHLELAKAKKRGGGLLCVCVVLFVHQKWRSGASLRPVFDLC